MTVTVEDRGRVRLITLDRPEKRNALDVAVSEALLDAFEAFAADDDAWVAVLAGRGSDFCAGVDLTSDARSTRRPRPPEGGITRHFECWKPVIAALQGNVLGGGLELALVADCRVADTTTRLGSPEVKWGLMQGAGATQRLPRAVPFGVALELLMTGDTIDAARAERLGLVNHVVTEGEALSAALELAERIASRAPLGVRRAKEAAYRGADLPLDAGIRLEQLLSRTLAGTRDLDEGRQAFADRRPARFEGR